jgi:hypothetical protein
MRLFGAQDHSAPPVFAGPGIIDIRSSTEIDFTMFATAGRDEDAIQRLVKARQNPYEMSAQFQLSATDYEGVEWACGVVGPVLKGMPKTGWPLTGKIYAMTTRTSGPQVAASSGVELLFLKEFWLPIDEAMSTVVSIGGEQLLRKWSRGRHALEVLGSEIRFFFTPSDDFLWLTATTSDKLSHPYAENWVSEPLRILLGQLIYPRLVARNFGNGSAHVALLPSPPFVRDSEVVSLLHRKPESAREDFWGLYASLLTVIAEARDEKGNPNFQAHPMTRFYEEIIQAMRWSRWVRCMTLASAAEGLSKMLMRPEDAKSDFADEEIQSLKDYAARWKGDERLRARIITELDYVSTKGIGKYLRDLVKQGVLKQSNERAWSSVRNAVMHGDLVSPWSTGKEEDDKLSNLIDLVRNLTYELIRRVGERG